MNVEAISSVTIRVDRLFRRMLVDKLLIDVLVVSYVLYVALEMPFIA